MCRQAPANWSLPVSTGLPIAPVFTGLLLVSTVPLKVSSERSGCTGAGVVSTNLCKPLPPTGLYWSAGLYRSTCLYWFLLVSTGVYKSTDLYRSRSLPVSGGTGVTGGTGADRLAGGSGMVPRLARPRRLAGLARGQVWQDCAARLAVVGRSTKTGAVLSALHGLLPQAPLTPMRGPNYSCHF